MKDFLFLFSFSITLSFTQEIKLTDYHVVQITGIVSAKERNEMISSDISGKILSYDLDTYSFKRTIKESDGFAIENLQLVGEEGVLFYKSKDSLFLMDPVSSSILSKFALNGKLIQQTNTRYAILALSSSYYNHNLMITDLENGVNKQLKTNNQVYTACITEDNKYVIYAEMSMNDQTIVCVDLENDNIVWTKPLLTSHKIIQLFNVKGNSVIDAVTFSDTEDVLSIFTFTDGNQASKPTLSIPFNATFTGTSVLDQFDTEKLLVITSNLYFDSPIVISFKKGLYDFKKCEVKNTYSSVLLNAKKQELIFANDLTYRNTGIGSFTVFDISTYKVKGIYPHSSNSFYTGCFLPDDNWMVYGSTANNWKANVKYYTSGTFYNRYHKSNFSDIIKEKLNTDSPLNLDYFNFNTGKYVFLNIASEKKNTLDSYEFVSKNAIYQYDLINDQIDLIYSFEDELIPHTVLDFNEGSKLLFLSQERYNPNWNNPQEITLIKDSRKEKLRGLYKEVKISNSGKYFLAINEKDLSQIFDLNNQKVFELQLTKGTYSVYAVDEDSFILSNSNLEKLSGKDCRDETIFLTFDDLKKYTATTQDCIYFSHISQKNGTVAVFIKDYGLTINEELTPIFFAKPPKSISLNTTGTKIMISFSDGKIGIYETSTFKELGAMFHPSDKEHIFYSSEGYYFSNTDASNFIFASKSGQNIALKDADQLTFQPKEVLSVFGKPNDEYVDVLTKSISVRKQKIDLDSSFNAINVDVSKNITEESSAKPNLYLLSIGVSDYQQDEYSLTFADKDALDIADLYGDLDLETIDYYNKKFYGHRFTLTSPATKEVHELKRYFGNYKHYFELFSIDQNNKKWIQIEEQEIYLWDFESGTVKSIIAPLNFKKAYGTFSAHRDIFLNPNSTAFYLFDRSNGDAFYQFNPTASAFKKIALPSFARQANFNVTGMQAISNNRFLYVQEPTAFETIIQIIIESTENKEENSRTIINLEHYTKHLSNEILKLDLIGNFYFKCASSDGKKILFLANNKTFIVDVENNAVPIELPIQIEYDEQVTLSSEGHLTVLKSSSGTNRYKVTTYAFDGRELYSKTSADSDLSINGISIYDSKPFFINSSNSLLKEKYSFEKFNENNLSPISFEKVEIQYLINDKATSVNIKNSLETFFTKVKPQDEVIVFLAGHGVLDEEKNYYYAPYDMDFNNVTANGISYMFIINKLKSSPAKAKLLMMDSCHSGNTLDITSASDKSSKTAIHEKGVAGERGSMAKATNKNSNFKMSGVLSSLFSDFLSTSGVTVLSASAGGDVAYENKSLGNGAFTLAFLKSFASWIPTRNEMKSSIILDDYIITEILNGVRKLTNGKQLPDIREINKNVEIKLW